MNDHSSRKLTSSLKNVLAQKVLEKRLKKLDDSQSNKENRKTFLFKKKEKDFDKYCRFDQFSGYKKIKIIEQGGKAIGLSNPFFKIHDRTSTNITWIQEKEYINYANYDYLGLASNPEVHQAAKQAIDIHGTSVSASRIMSGERLLHKKLEAEIATTYGVDDCLTFVSGHATNVTTIGYLFGSKDLVLHDALIHDSVLQGIKLSGAKRIPFKHNDYNELDTILTLNRKKFERVLIVLEGLYSMDGDCPEIDKFIEIKQKHHAFLMVDEAHSFGVVGQTGLGIREHYGLKGSEVDIWMGTLSKALAGCGGYIAGEKALVKHLRYSAPGFLYSVGMTPPTIATSLAALKVMKSEPERVQALQKNGQLFLKLAKENNLDTGLSQGYSIIPILTGGSIRAAKLANYLFENGIDVQLVFYPAVEEKMARLRFFINAFHTEEQIKYTVKKIVDGFRKV